MTDLKEPFAEYVIAHNFEDVLDIMARTDGMQHYSIVIEFLNLFETQLDLGEAFLMEPDRSLAQFDAGLIAAQKSVMDSVVGEGKEQYSVKVNVHVRITGFQNTQVSKTNFSVFPRNEHHGNFLKVSGTVVKVTLPKLLEYEREYMCSKCATSAMAYADFNLCNVIQTPKTCPNQCTPAIFTPVKAEDGGRYKDYQELKLQEEMGKMQLGAIPASVWATVDHDLVDKCHPGDRVTICGVAKRRWRGLSVGGRGDVELVVKANNLEVTNHQKTASLVTDEVRARNRAFWDKYKNRPLEGRDIILASFCPEVYGLYLVKLALCVVLSGGVPTLEEGGGAVRAEPHLLLVGDPGTGKSHLLRFAARASVRAVLTTGVGSTTAGLTVCAVREGSDWQLEAGALVLADGGVCCIDELNSIREADRTSVHEAMEQQTISVAKAGMVTKLNTRCSVLAATNAKGPYDPSESLCVNVALASPLLSRFDLVLVLQDTRSQDWDRLLSSFILELVPKDLQPSPELWTIDELQSYFALAKTYHPVMTASATEVLKRYYQAQRGADSRNAARTTVRMLESLVRLSQGHARLMLRDQVTVLDAVVAVTLVECSMAASALIAAANALHCAFSTDPQRQYRHQAELVLKKLNLEDILEKETARLDRESGKLAAEQTEEKGNLAEAPPSAQPPDPANFFSQKFTEILTDIRKKRDRDICDAVALTGKRRREPVKKKRKLKKLNEDEEELVANKDEEMDVLGAIEEGEEPEPEVAEIRKVEPKKPGKIKRKKVETLRKISEGDENETSIQAEKDRSNESGCEKSLTEKPDREMGPEKRQQNNNESEFTKPAQSTMDKLRMFQKTSRLEKPERAVPTSPLQLIAPALMLTPISKERRLEVKKPTSTLEKLALFEKALEEPESSMYFLPKTPAFSHSVTDVGNETITEPERKKQSTVEKLKGFQVEFRLEQPKKVSSSSLLPTDVGALPEPELKKPAQSTKEKLQMFQTNFRLGKAKVVAAGTREQVPTHPLAMSPDSGLAEEASSAMSSADHSVTSSQDFRKGSLVTSTPLCKVTDPAAVSPPSSFAYSAIADSPRPSITLPSAVPASTELLTAPNPPKRGFDRKKLKALVKLGKSLSQSQSSGSQAKSQLQGGSQSDSQQQSGSQIASSQFSLHEMAWDDLEVELE